MLLFLQMKVGAPLAGSSTAPDSFNFSLQSIYINILVSLMHAVLCPRSIVSFLKSTYTGQNSQGLQVMMH